MQFTVTSAAEFSPIFQGPGRQAELWLQKCIGSKEIQGAEGIVYHSQLTAGELETKRVMRIF